MSTRRSPNKEPLQLSLTGSQITSISSKRPQSAKLKRPSSLSDIPNKSRTESPGRKYDCEVNHVSNISSARSQHKTVPSKQRKDSPRTFSHKIASNNQEDEFLALFESSTKPKIRSTTSNRHTKSPKTNKNLALNVLRSHDITNTFQREAKGISGYKPSTNNVFYRIPLSTDCSSPELSECGKHNWTSLDQINRTLQAASCLLKEVKLGTDDEPNVTNNLSALGRSPRPKASVSSIENIKHKTPVNEIQHGQIEGSNPCGNLLPRDCGAVQSNSVYSTTNDRGDFNIDYHVTMTGSDSYLPPADRSNHISGYEKVEEYIQRVNQAATMIQKWYRRHQTRRKMAKAAVKRLMEQKKQELESAKMGQSLYNEVKVADRKKIREEKSQAARKLAIEELQRKREARKDEVKRIAEDELIQLKTDGKIPSSIKADGKIPLAAKRGTARKKENHRHTSNSQVSHSDANNLIDDNNSSCFKSPPADVNLFFEDKRKSLEVQNGEISGNAAKVTIEDLFSTLKELEQEDKIEPPHHRTESQQGIREYLSIEKLERLNVSSPTSRPGLLSDDKIKSIHMFLDEVESAERVSALDTDFNRHLEDIEYPPILVPSVNDLETLEQAAATANEVTSTVLSQKMQLDEKDRTVKLLQKALNQQRELTVRHARDSDKEMKKRLDVQKNEYEEAVTRHLSFIDQLIDDKKSLSEKCEQMVKELKVTDSKYQERIKILQDNHTVELKKMEEMMKAAEKLRREKWTDDMTKKIKERTVKGLEPEIQRLIAKHKSEIKKLKQIHEAELLEADERAAQRYVKMTEDLRDQLAVEKESACTRERELAKQRYEKQMQQEEESYQQQRRRFLQEVQDEKERLSQQAARQRFELDKLQQQLEQSHSQALEAMKSEFEAARQQQEHRHTTELRETKERLGIEKEAWEENYRKKQEAWLAQKERELKDSLRKERDQEIELVITRLEEDSSVSRQDCERSADNKIRRIRDKYEGEIRELEISEKQTMEKYNKVKAEMAKVEGENERLKVIVKQKDDEIADVKRMSEKLHNERDRVSEVVRQEYVDRIVSTEEENKHIRNEIPELRSRHKLELEKMQSELEIMQKKKDDEMEEVHSRVKQAIVKKEEVVNQLKQQYQAAVKRADHLEGLLEQQRKLIKK